MAAKVLRIAGLVIVLIPVVFLVLLGIGEVSGGVPGGAFHFVQAAPLLMLAVLAWKRPLEGGGILVGTALLLMIFDPVASSGARIGPALAVDLILFGPPIVAGCLLMVAGWTARRRTLA